MSSDCGSSLLAHAANTITMEIACSVTRDRRYQSYVVQGGPQWLSSLLEAEAGY
ncbi:hypothetical protein F2Q68_00021516 [Brassica cretica]|uniref:Uncharacterized protein n=1 Tax=Brassica cretica TaxID=69181 RepID=A0A8S9G3G5_BRACR|nr:hypothetical protein F2Q68_00021516 [Brassica cretica]